MFGELSAEKIFKYGANGCVIKDCRGFFLGFSNILPFIFCPAKNYLRAITDIYLNENHLQGKYPVLLVSIYIIFPQS